MIFVWVMYMNKSNIGASTNFLQIILDIIVSAVAFVIVYFVVSDKSIYIEEISKCIVLYVVFMFVYILTNKDSRVYNITTFFYSDRIFKHVTKSFVLSSLVVSALLFYVADSEFDKIFFSTFLIVAYIML